MYNCFAAAAGYSYIQVIHCPAFYHWLTVEIQFNEDVQVFDSKYSNYHLRLRSRFHHVIKSKHNQISLHSVVKEQYRLWPICHSVCYYLFHGIDPTGLLYEDGSQLRQHFLKFLQEGCLTPFPSKQTTKWKPQLQSINIYSVCRIYMLEHKRKRIFVILQMMSK